MLKVFTEAGFEIGFGHFYRTSGICDTAVRNHIETEMVLFSDQAARNNLARSYVSFADWNNVDVLPQLISEDDVLVVDSYMADMNVLQEMQRLSVEMIVIDDNMRLPYRDMTVLNPNYYAMFLEYPKEMGNTYYLGKDYTLLREPFRHSFSREVRTEVRDVLVTMGGTDPMGVTLQVLRYIDTFRKSDLRLHVVATAAYKDIDEIKRSLRPEDQCLINADAEGMCRLMKQADFAIATAGGTSNELIRMQVPSILIQVAGNQGNNVALMSEAGFFDTFDLDHMGKIKSMISLKKRLGLVSKMKTLASNRTAADLILEKMEEGSRYERKNHGCC